MSLISDLEVILKLPRQTSDSADPLQKRYYEGYGDGFERCQELIRRKLAKISESQLKIVCAAIKFEVGLTVCGFRHWDNYMKRHILDSGRKNLGAEEQGFIDNKGDFHNRIDSWKIAEAAGQIIKRVGGDCTDGGTLFSENLY